MNLVGLGIVVLGNALSIGAFYVFFGIIARRASKRLQAASLLLHTMPDASMADKFDSLVEKVGKRAGRTFWIVLLVTLLVLIAGFEIYAKLVNPDADMISWLSICIILGGVGFLGAMVILGDLIKVDFQLIAASRFLKQEAEEHPNSEMLTRAMDVTKVRVGEHGVSILSFAAVVGSMLSGLLVVSVLFLSAQTAIECARSSKCL